jgi:8-oxo-dGTP pyrophosphatase MutT (NUDIX family)
MNTTKTNVTKYVGAGIILTRLDGNEPRFLMMCGRDTTVWSFSKGHPEISDRNNPLRTAVRETHEETGLLNDRDYTIVGDSTRFGKRPYWVGVVKPEAFTRLRVARKEHSMAAWLTWNEISQLNTNTDVRVWLKKSNGAYSNFTNIISHCVSAMQPMHSNVQECNAS